MVDTDHGTTFHQISAAQKRFLTWTVDVLTYVLILNLFAEFASDHIAIDSFWITLFVAVLFRMLLSSMGRVKTLLKSGLKSRGRPILATLGVLPVFFVGKLIILEVVDALFRQVTLAGFWYEWFLIFFLIVIPALVWAIFEKLGN